MYKEYLLNLHGELIKLEKGMSEKQIESIIGIPFDIEYGATSSNKKLFYKTSRSVSSNGTYVILLTNDELVYVAKLN